MLLLTYSYLLATDVFVIELQPLKPLYQYKEILIKKAYKGDTAGIIDKNDHKNK